MVLLNRKAATLAVLALLPACAPSNVTVTTPLDSDTYISSTDATNHSELPYLRISNTGDTEERALVKLPTGKEDQDYNLTQIFANLSNPLTWPLAPFVIIADIFAAFFNCTSQTLAAANLTSSYLVLNVNQNAGGAALTQLTIQHLGKPWWQTVSWSQAFPFSGAGSWAQAGGDLDPSFTPIAATSPSAGTIQFDVTNYFRTLLQSQTTPHYGFVMRSAGGASLSPVLLNSVQFTDATQRPRLVSTYKCIAPIASSLQAEDRRATTAEPSPQPYTYYLGHL